MYQNLHVLMAAGMVTGSAALSVAEATTEPRPNAQVVEMMGEISPDNIRAIVDTLAGFGTRHTLSETDSEVRGIGAARRYIKAEFEKYASASGRSDENSMLVFFDTYQLEPDGRRITKSIELKNVIAELPGADEEARQRRYYVIGHYDSRATGSTDAESDAPGANDDASGVALLMELARVMSTRRFDATIVFMATAGEEQGLYGAKLHAEKAKAQGWNIAGVLSSDMVGDPTNPMQPDQPERGRVRVFSAAIPQDATEQEISMIRRLGMEVDSPSRQLARYIREIGSAYANESVRLECAAADNGALIAEPVLIYRTDRFLRGGDQTAFNRAGFPGVRFTEMEENYDRQHQDIRIENGRAYGDVPEFVNEEYVAAVARLNVCTLAHLANAPAEPSHVRILTAELENKTRLRWDLAEAKSDVAGYHVVWRETTSPYWEHMLNVGLSAEATLLVNKDNAYFGVRSYDASGNLSPVVFAGAANR